MCLLLLLLLLWAAVLVDDVRVVAAPLGRADIGIAVTTMAAHCCCVHQGSDGGSVDVALSGRLLERNTLRH
jgi:hypothetical protein